MQVSAPCSATARSFLYSAPWYALGTGGAIVLLILGFSLLGEGLQQRGERMARVLNIRDLRVHFFKHAAPDRFAVDGLNLSIQEGEILGMVGESGSGKTVTAMSVSGLLPGIRPRSAAASAWTARDIQLHR
ncbi:MAG: ATP-binding cassette domain-containing protein [Oscillospiraceae bacterium]